MKRVEVAQPQTAIRPSVLYVEDEDQNWSVTELRLRGRYQLVRAATDQEACALLASRGHELHAVLMDIQLKGSQLNGMELTQLLRGQAIPGGTPSYAKQVPVSQVPIIFVTAYSDRLERIDLGSLGADAVVTKPVDFLKLTLALANAHASRAIQLARPSSTPRVS